MQTRLQAIIEIIRDHVKAEKIFLLPSDSPVSLAPFAQQLPSSYFLVLGNSKYQKQKPIEECIEKECRRVKPVHIIVHDIHWFNDRLHGLIYFYPELEYAQTVYDHNRVHLFERMPADMRLVQRSLRQCFHYLYNKAQQHIERALLSWKSHLRDLEAISQGALDLYTAAEIVFTGLDPQTRNLLRLRRSTGRFSSDLADVFPNHSLKEKKMLERLHKHAIKKPMREINPIPSDQYEGYLKRIQDLQMIILLVCQGYINRLSPSLLQ